MKCSRQLLYFCLFFLAGFLIPLLNSAQAPVSSRQRITGRVLSDKTSEPLPYVPVILRNPIDSGLIKGGLTNEKGLFSIEDIHAGPCRLEIKFLGYEPFIRDTAIALDSAGTHNFGDIRLAAAGKHLNEITITEEKEDAHMGADKKVFYVENDLNSKGGTAIDALRNIPSVSVDGDGKLNVRGSSDFTILIDGRPSGMSGENGTNILNQIPVSSIERIELLTSPSAKYDPNSISAIINIVLKKNKLNNKSAFMAASYSTFRKESIAFGAGYKNAKINIYANYSYRHYERWYSGFTNRRNILQDTTFYTNQNSEGELITDTHMGKIGFDYSFNPKNVLSFTGIFNYTKERDNDHVTYNFLDQESRLTQTGIRNMTGIGLYQGFDLNMNYMKHFENPDKQLSMDCSVSGNANNVADSIGQENYNSSNMPLTALPAVIRTFNKGMTVNYLAKLDYMQPFGEHGTIECGFQFNGRNYDLNFTADTFNFPALTWQNEPALGNRFVYTERIYAAYGIWSQERGRFSYQAGLRIEKAQQGADAPANQVSYTRDFFNIYPSGVFSFKLTDQSDLHLNYGKRTGRPAMRYINPLIDYTDPFNPIYGNPGLQPETIYYTELSYAHYFKRGSFHGALFYRYQQDLLEKVLRLSDSIRGILTTTYQNLNSGFATGIEATVKFDYSRWLSLSLNMNAFELRAAGSAGAQNVGFTTYNYYMKLNAQVRFEKKYTFVAAANYAPRTGVVQGYKAQQYFLDIAVRRELWNKKASLTLGLSDVFNSLASSFIYTYSGFEEHYYKKKESRMLTLSFSYAFGSQAEAKPKPSKMEEPSVPPILPPE